MNHNLPFDKHAVFLESSKTPLPLTNDTFVYGGMTLHIKGKIIKMKLLINFNAN